MPRVLQLVDEHRRRPGWIVIVLTIFAAIVCGNVWTKSRATNQLIGSEGNMITSAVLPDRRQATVFEMVGPVCEQCTLEVERIATFGRDSDSLALTDMPIVANDSRNMFFATVKNSPKHGVVVYGPTGLTQGVLGGIGQGPGEFLVVWDLFVGQGDSVFVGHDANRVSMFAPNGQFMRSIRLSPPPSSPTGARILGVTDSVFLLGDSGGDPDNLSPLRLYSREGELLRSFGPQGLHRNYQLAAGKKRLNTTRVAAWDGGDTVWLAGPEQGYRIENSDLRGRSTRVIGVRGDSTWYTDEFPELLLSEADYEKYMKATARMREAVSQSRPAPKGDLSRAVTLTPLPLVIQGLYWDGAHLMVVSHVFSTPVLGQAVLPLEEPLRDLMDFRTSIIDVLDPSTGELLARAKLPGAAYVTSGGRLYRPRLSSARLIHFDAFRVTFRQPTTREGG